ncbi:putative HTH-type transcriptional regulator YraN [Sporosarcina luteola]|uniref:Putative HTH-type transcriptional regulator YraN n=1 Tax=Sporosarcina luteola TaxID=582850 RepID=A0A511Z337_9BACL|nr:LysR family transcriptional regulator [Sporosarcina luteola]GEN81868.1 putative HTH-type transcriptional regulator YraN [Sporosarcina luteola]
MEERDWILLTKIGEGKNISQVSEELFITQPALTYRVNKIENEFGAKLFIRGNKGIKPNHQGEYVIRYAERMIKELQNAREEVLSMSSRIKGKIYIGASNAVAQYVLPDLLSKFLKKYPEVEPHVLTGFSPYLTDLLINEKIHVAFLREDLEWLHFKKFLTKETIYLVNKEEVEIENLPLLPRINYKTNQSLKSMIDVWWSKSFQKPPYITMEVDNGDVCLEIVRAGLGYAILTELGLSKEKHLWRKPMTNHLGEPLQRETWLYGSKESDKYYTVKAFMDFIDEEDMFQLFK